MPSMPARNLLYLDNLAIAYLVNAMVHAIVQAAVLSVHQLRRRQWSTSTIIFYFESMSSNLSCIECQNQ